MFRKNSQSKQILELFLISGILFITNGPRNEILVSPRCLEDTGVGEFDTMIHDDPPLNFSISLFTTISSFHLLEICFVLTTETLLIIFKKDPKLKYRSIPKMCSAEDIMGIDRYFRTRIVESDVVIRMI